MIHSKRLHRASRSLGAEIWQWPSDMFAIQELLFKTRPDFVIETGTALGGSAIFYASVLELLGKGSVISIDIDMTRARGIIENHFLGKRIILVEGDSKSEETQREVRKIVGQGSVNVFLDSDHSTSHVLAELRNFSEIVKVGNYIVVFDTDIAYTGDGRKRFNKNNNPLLAVRQFLTENNDFVIDRYYEKYLLTFIEEGFLQRVTKKQQT